MGVFLLKIRRGKIYQSIEFKYKFGLKYYIYYMNIKIKFNI